VVLAAVFGVLAIAGSSGPIWWSDIAPRAGQPYAAISYTGSDNFGCGGSVGRQPLATTAYTINSTTVCVLQIPRGTAGKTLLVGFFVSANTSRGSTLPTARRCEE
jgi:hypothetical protein